MSKQLPSPNQFIRKKSDDFRQTDDPLAVKNLADNSAELELKTTIPKSPSASHAFQHLQLHESLSHLHLVNSLATNDADEILRSILKLNSGNNYHPAYGSPLHLVTSLCNENVVEKVIKVFYINSAVSERLNWINTRNVSILIK